MTFNAWLARSFNCTISPVLIAIRGLSSNWIKYWMLPCRRLLWAAKHKPDRVLNSAVNAGSALASLVIQTVRQRGQLILIQEGHLPHRILAGEFHGDAKGPAAAGDVGGFLGHDQNGAPTDGNRTHLAESLDDDGVGPGLEIFDSGFQRVGILGVNGEYGPGGGKGKKDFTHEFGFRV
jgi:hypothetical protein